MRFLVCGLLVLSLQACARDDVALGSEGNGNGGSSGGSQNTTGTKPDDDAGPTTGGGNDANGADATGGDGGGSTGDSCPAASCESPMDGGELKSDVNGTARTIMGRGHAFVKVSAKDGDSGSNSVGGVRATLTAATGNYDLYAYGGRDSAACDDLGIASTLPAGETDSVAPTWGTEGLNPAKVNWTLTFEVRPADGSCDGEWSLVLEGNPCPAFTLTVPKQCP